MHCNLNKASRGATSHAPTGWTNTEVGGPGHWAEQQGLALEVNKIRTHPLTLTQC